MAKWTTCYQRTRKYSQTDNSQLPCTLTFQVRRLRNKSYQARVNWSTLAGTVAGKAWPLCLNSCTRDVREAIANRFPELACFVA